MSRSDCFHSTFPKNWVVKLPGIRSLCYGIRERSVNRLCTKRVISIAVSCAWRRFVYNFFEAFFKVKRPPISRYK